MNDRMTVAVYGATGHTGSFVVAELKRRGFGVVRIGRDAARLRQSSAGDSTPWRVAGIDDPEQLDAALRGTHAVINCAGPFLDTALPVVDAALRARIPYLDVTAEQPALQALIEQRDTSARAAGVTLIPAAAFYGGLADLLVTAAADEDKLIERVDIAIGLDSWHPTRGTRLTGERNRAIRLIQEEGRLVPVPQPAPEGVWSFQLPFGNMDVVMLPFTEVLTVSRHLRIDTVESWFALSALRDIRDPNTPAPQPHDEQGRSAQQFVVDVVIEQSGTTRRVTATGRDIYAVSAPIVVEATERLLSGKVAPGGGVVSLGEIFDARDFLAALDTVTVSYSAVSSPMLTRRGEHEQQ
ncbi:NAD(P)H-binding protein [Paraburkholderia sp. 1N]|uniref:NAD(P)H-binding protein n=1 Tax=Paraburkholderia solitsugae TaxID=2675748 RepID=A0ABX2BZF2_9BURK|nr:saccharopine dehydrogenase NADP-binding domain-containing protein [Paraburkholderia solitsugae]NPT45012.1 NAD(P)H-binding protein [Paraburkholderia solitsugae]